METEQKLVKKIFKYSLQMENEQTLELPAGSEILSVLVQEGVLMLYAIVMLSANVVTLAVPYSIRIIGTGWEMEESPLQEGYTFLGTVGMRNNSLVWHVFYKKI